MDTNECQPVYIDIQEFYEGLNMKVEQQIPLLLVERQALNEAREAEKMVSDMISTIPQYDFRNIYNHLTSLIGASPS
jgi:hypothetical protein